MQIHQQQCEEQRLDSNAALPHKLSSSQSVGFGIKTASSSMISILLIALHAVSMSGVLNVVGATGLLCSYSCLNTCKELI